MKYNSPGRKIRLDWIKVKGPMFFEKTAHQWCKQNGSDNGFYKHYASDSWWFELESDAVLFNLRWAGKGKNHDNRFVKY